MNWSWLNDWIGNETTRRQAIVAAAIVAGGLVSYVVVRWILSRTVTRLAAKTKTRWDDALVKRKVFAALAYLAPAVVVYLGASYFPTATDALRKAVLVYVVGNAALLFHKVLTAAHDIYQTYPIAKRRPLKGYLQIATMLGYILAGIVGIAIALDRSPWGLLTGIGALTAVLLLVFKDTILSFIASIQIVSNDMVRVGDWIEMPNYGADGDVIEIALHTVKVQNFDKTITTIPTYKLIEDSFKNWRGMVESGGRRICRSILIDQRSIRFLDDADLDRLETVELICDYVKSRRAEIAEYNRKRTVDPSLPVNGRRMTNIGTFRAYVLAYLAAHPSIHDELIQLVRQLPPTPHGLPLQIYAFTNDNAWIAYEGIQSDVFDHLLAALPQFGLRVFQQPTGYDVADIGSNSWVGPTHSGLQAPSRA